MRHARWLALAAIAVAVAATSYGIFAPWLDVATDARLGVERGLVEQLPGWAWAFAAIALAGIAFAMIAGKRRHYLPRQAALVLAATGVVGAAAMLVTIRMLGRSVAVDAFGDRVAVTIAPGAWIVVAGFAGAAIAGLWLWRIAVAAQHESEAERAKVERQLGAKDGDLPAPNDKPPAL